MNALIPTSLADAQAAACRPRRFRRFAAGDHPMNALIPASLAAAQAAVEDARSRRVALGVLRSDLIGQRATVEEARTAALRQQGERGLAALVAGGRDMADANGSPNTEVDVCEREIRRIDALLAAWPAECAKADQAVIAAEAVYADVFGQSRRQCAATRRCWNRATSKSSIIARAGRRPAKS